MIFNKHREFLLNNISNEHKEFILIISELYDASIKNLSNEKILHILDELTNYTYFHFQWEEKNCKFCKPYLHTIKDSLLIEKLDEYRFDFECKKINSEELFECVMNWLLMHLKSHETINKEFLNDQLNPFISIKNAEFDSFKS